jgi:hypothetical protein
MFMIVMMLMLWWWWWWVMKFGVPTVPETAVVTVWVSMRRSVMLVVMWLFV